MATARPRLDPCGCSPVDMRLQVVDDGLQRTPVLDVEVGEPVTVEVEHADRDASDDDGYDDLGARTHVAGDVPRKGRHVGHHLARSEEHTSELQSREK